MLSTLLTGSKCTGLKAYALQQGLDERILNNGLEEERGKTGGSHDLMVDKQPCFPRVPPRTGGQGSALDSFHEFTG